MRKVWMIAVAAAALAPQTLPAQDATVRAAARAMGADALQTIRYSGRGSMYGFQQAPEPGGPWPRFDANTYSVAIDYRTPAMRLETARSQGEHPPRGGSGQPIAGEQRSIQLVSADLAWGESASGSASPSPGAAAGRRQQLWLTPHGLVKAALAAGATANGRTIPLTVEGQDLTVTLDERDRVARVDYQIYHPVLGDTPVEILYSDYRDHGGVSFPGRIVETRGGFPTLDITVERVEPNAPVALTVPQNVRNAPARAEAAPAAPADPAAEAQEIAEGVWYLSGGNPRSVLVEFADHVVVVEGPSGDERSLAVMELAGRLAPGKPIRYLVNTHHHFDHSGGLRAYVARGIPIITHEINRPFFEEVWKRPHTLQPDLLARSPRAPVFETMTDRKVLTDGTRTLELHHIRGSGHAPGYIMAYLPAERILIYADSYNPPAGDDPRDRGRTNEYAEALYGNIIERLRPEPVTLAPLHGRVVPFENLKKAIGLVPVTQ